MQYYKVHVRLFCKSTNVITEEELNSLVTIQSIELINPSMEICFYFAPIENYY